MQETESDIREKEEDLKKSETTVSPVENANADENTTQSAESDSAEVMFPI